MSGLLEDGWDKAESLIEATADHGQAVVGEAPDAEPHLYYVSVDEFVREYLRHLYRRHVGPRTPYRWAADWWEYPEAITRLEALWRSWEHLRLDPATGMSVWLRDHADYHMRVLFSADGPFRKSEDMSQHDGALPYMPPPIGLF